MVSFEYNNKQGGKAWSDKGKTYKDLSIEQLKAGKNIDRYLYIVSQYRIKKQSEFRDIYTELFGDILNPSTVTHNFQRYNIKKNKETGIYEESKQVVETDADRLFRLLSDKATKAYYQTDATPNYAVVVTNPDYVADIAKLIYELCNIENTAIIVGYNSLLLIGLDVEDKYTELYKIMFKFSLAFANPVLNPFKKPEQNHEQEQQQLNEQEEQEQQEQNKQEEQQEQPKQEQQQLKQEQTKQEQKIEEKA